MKRVMVVVAAVAAVAAAVAVARRDRGPAPPEGSWQPVDHAATESP